MRRPRDKLRKITGLPRTEIFALFNYPTPHHSELSCSVFLLHYYRITKTCERTTKRKHREVLPFCLDQLSPKLADYVFSALGFYPVCPGSNQYVIGTPYFKQATVHLENGNTLSIDADGEGCYIQQMTLNGADYQHNYLDHNQLMQGAIIHFNMDTKPNKQRGTQPQDAPYSFTNAQ